MKLLFGILTIPLLPFVFVIWICLDLLLLARFEPIESVKTLAGFWKELYWL